jgi:hypothetical protein
MLAHLKAKHRGELHTMGQGEDGDNSPPPPVASVEAPGSVEPEYGGIPESMDDEQNATQVTCDVLCSLGAAAAGGVPTFFDTCDDSPEPSINGGDCKRKSGGKTCPKQHQLPMFLSSKFSFIIVTIDRSYCRLGCHSRVRGMEHSMMRVKSCKIATRPRNFQNIEFLSLTST